MSFDLFSAIGAVAGVLGLGNMIDRQQVKLRVTPAPAFGYDGQPAGISVEVVNLSSFAVVIDEIGFNRRDGRRYSFMGNRLNNGRTCPCRLEARESVSALFPVGSFDLNQATTGFARTSCGKVISGDSPGWKQVRED